MDIVQNIIIERLLTPTGVDRVLLREITAGLSPEDARVFCRKRLESELTKEGNPTWPTVGQVRIVDESGVELARYGYDDLQSDRSQEHRAKIALERKHA